MALPLVSVLLPVYNGGHYLKAALDSILCQDYERLEIIAIDDGSTDNSLEILQRYQNADSRISIVSRENRGLIATLNEGLTVAQGELVARMDADDIAYPSRLSRQVAVFTRHPQCAICGSAVDMLIGDRLVKGVPDPIYRDCSLRILSLFFTIFIHSTVVYNRRVIPQDMLSYDPRYLHAEDFDLFRRITERFPATMIEDRLIAYRIHDESVSSRHKRQMRKTHLHIVSENLEREFLLTASNAVCNVGDAVTSETVRQIAECILALDARVAMLPPETRPSFEEGALNFFYFVYQLIGDELQPEFTHEFLTRTGKWELIRRRERYGLLAGARAPWLSRISIGTTKRIDTLSRYLQSVPAVNVLPRYRMI